jgi:Flp pilus assembly pilin Flp
MKNKGLIAVGIQLVIVAFLLIGEVKCIVKAIKCNWEPIGKAEVIYTAAACTGLGSIVGWIDIEDN